MPAHTRGPDLLVAASKDDPMAILAIDMTSSICAFILMYRTRRSCMLFCILCMVVKVPAVRDLNTFLITFGVSQKNDDDVRAVISKDEMSGIDGNMRRHTGL